MIRMGISFNGRLIFTCTEVSKLYFKPHIWKCINERLLPFTEKNRQDGNNLFRPDLASAYYLETFKRPIRSSSR